MRTREQSTINNSNNNNFSSIVHPAVGFGVMNAKKLVDVAQKNWNTVPQRRNCSIKLSNLP